MKYYSHSNNEILVGHFPGLTRTIEDIKNKMLEFSNIKFHKPDNIDIVCVMTKDHESTAPLINQLKLNGYDYKNYLHDKNIIWKHVMKVFYVLESLKMCDKEYSLVLDGDDVAILTDLDDIIERFNTYNKKIIFNATIWMFPKDILDYVEDRQQYGDFCYLNAGCCFGKTSDLISFYEETYNLFKNVPHPVDSEQYYIRKAFDKHQDTVFFDYDCRIFQCWHKPRYEYKTVNGEERCYLM